MRRILHIILTIAAAVSILYWMKEWFDFDHPWIANLVCFVLPALSFLLLRNDRFAEIIYYVECEKMVDLQTNETLQEIFDPAAYSKFSLNYEEQETKVYVHPSGKMIMTRMVQQKQRKQLKTPLILWLVYLVLTALISYILWVMIVHECSFSERLTAFLSTYFGHLAK